MKKKNENEKLEIIFSNVSDLKNEISNPKISPNISDLKNQKSHPKNSPSVTDLKNQISPSRIFTQKNSSSEIILNEKKRKHEKIKEEFEKMIQQNVEETIKKKYETIISVKKFLIFFNFI